MSRLGFELQAEAAGSRARAGRLRTLHGEVLTPIFMPVGTQATVKSQTVESLEAVGSQVLLANTYHLLLRPGPEVFRKFGGIHRFMGWNKSVLTDSGGFQIFSLPHSRRLTEEGAAFQSYVDGRRILLTPELSIETQKAIGSDIMMVLDQCVPSTCDHATAKAAMELTHRWAKRSLVARGDSAQSMFGIVQGACFEDLRRESARVLTDMPFDGFAIGGLAVGEGKELRERFCELTADLLPRQLPRYLMGVGMPIDILEAVHRGVDMFDCVLPSSLGQRGAAFTSLGKVQLRRTVYKFSEEPLDPACGCPTCVKYSRAYLHHLIKADEVLGWHLVAQHNLHFYQGLMRRIRESILEGRFGELYREEREVLLREDEENPARLARPVKPTRNRRILGDYEVVVGAAGVAAIRQISSGEVMHSVNDPMKEARELYLEQSRFVERICCAGEELVLWDVGLGAATNAMTAILAYESAGGSRPVRIVSFENNLDSLRLALRHVGAFEHLKHPAPSALLKEGVWRSKRGPLRWELVHGDFFETMTRAPRPELIFYDPFSYKTDSPLWTLECFKRVFSICGGGPTELFTYSASTAVRAALLGAGFLVARGRSSGPKAETTIAVTPGTEHPHELLGEEWIGRWERSRAQLPAGIEAAMIRGHRQFRANPPPAPAVKESSTS